MPGRETQDTAQRLAHARSELILQALRVFIAVEKTRSIVDAAGRIGSSPSSVSQKITVLESAVGTKLFDRDVRPLALTPAGQRLLVHARGILESVSNIHWELVELDNSNFSNLAITVIDDLDASVTPDLVAGLQNRYCECFVGTRSG